VYVVPALMFVAFVGASIVIVGAITSGVWFTPNDSICVAAF
tara:strand:- start:372 stop:494 length:123 start_codon:yes stop_codon:yes gene_type:complete